MNQSEVTTTLNKTTWFSLKGLLMYHSFEYPVVLRADSKSRMTIQTHCFNFQIKLCLKYSLLYQNASLTTNFSQFSLKNNFGFPWWTRTIPSYLKSSVDLVTCVTSDKWAFSKFKVCLYFSLNYEDSIKRKYKYLKGNVCKFLLAKISSI